MTKIIKKIHMYLGLLCCSALLVYAVAGLYSMSFVRPIERPRPEPSARIVDFQAPPNATDKQVADLIWEKLAIPMAGKIPDFAIRRDQQHNLNMTFYTVNGQSRVTFMERERQLRVELRPTTLSMFANGLHTATLRNNSPDIRMTLWKYYNEFAIWALILMSVSGPYLWLASRPRFRWAQISLATGAGGFLALYFLSR